MGHAEGAIKAINQDIGPTARNPVLGGNGRDLKDLPIGRVVKGCENGHRYIGMKNMVACTNVTCESAAQSNSTVWGPAR